MSEPPGAARLDWGTGGLAEVEPAALLAQQSFDPHYREAWTEAQMAGLLAAPGGWLDLGRHGGRLVTFAMNRQALDEVELLLCAVAPDQRGRGLGRQLMEQVVQSCRRRGARRLFLEVRSSNSPALGLYRSFGFVIEGRRPAYYRTLGGDSIDALTLAFDL